VKRRRISWLAQAELPLLNWSHGGSAQYCPTMARTTETISLTLRPQTLKALDAAAQQQRRSRSQFVDLVLQGAPSVTGETRLRDLQAIAAAGLAEYADDATRERAPNATALIADASTEGQRMLDAHRAIAAGNRKGIR
jgi:uncharacterized protein (DUF1778 family)